MSKLVRLPLLAIAETLRNARTFAVRNRPTGDDTLDCDVRLQVYPGGQWAVHSGPRDYDQDHRGAWGAGSVPLRGPFDSVSLARDLINQAVDMAVDGGIDVTLAYATPRKARKSKGGV